MSVNLLEMARGLFSPQTESTLATVINEPPSGISKALNGIVPAIFAGLIHKSSSSAGASDLTGLAQAETDNSILDNIGGLLGGNDESGILGKGSGLLTSLFGNKSDALLDRIAQYSGLKSSSSKSLISLALPAILGFIGKYIKSKELDSQGLAGLLAGQKQHVQAAIPAGLNLGDLTGLSFADIQTPEATVEATPVSHATHSSTTFREVQEEDESGGGLKWLLPILLLALVAAATLYFYRGCNNNAPDAHATDNQGIEAHTDKTGTHTDAASIATSTVDAKTLGTVGEDGNFMYNTGSLIEMELPNNGGTLQVGENSTEAQLIRFLQSNQAVDTAQGNWFNFTNVRFVTGKSTIQDASLDQLKNLVTIAKAFPNAQFKIGGYTDNTGDAALNINLSKERAAAVLAKLKELGASASSVISSDGYGDAFPIGDNNTAEGRALNRRVAVNVKAK